MSSSNRPTQLLDNNNATLPHTAMDDILNISKFGTEDIVIVGYARTNSANDEPNWKIYFNTYDSVGNIVRMRHAVVGSESNNDYSKVWTSSPTKVITGATKANPCILTITAHGYTTGDFIEVDSVVGMTEINSDGYGSKVYHVTVINANSVSLQEATDTSTNIDSTAFTNYTSGGKAYKHEHLNYTWA